MKTKIATITAILLILPLAQQASAEGIPDWIRNNAMWWSEGTITQDDFILGIQFLVKEKILNIPPTAVSSEKSSNIPDWVKNNAKWWSQGSISDGDFVNGIQHLIKIGIVAVPISQQVMETPQDSQPNSLESKLKACKEKPNQREIYECEKELKKQIKLEEYKANSQKFVVGPITFYYPGQGTEGNDFTIGDSGQPILTIRMLAENTGSSENVSMMCTGPSICNYDVFDGSKAFKYSGMDFTNGQIVIKPGESREFNMLFGPNIGYGGTTFEYDSAKDYFFRINEPWGKMSIPIGIQ